jgi:hypothetical protein
MRNKRGMFFMILSVVLVTFLIFSLTFFSFTKDRDAIEERINTLNGFVFAAEEDLKRRLFISGFRMIFLFEKRIIERGEYIDDADARFDELFFSGTLYGDSFSDVTTGATFADIKDELERKAGKIGANLSLYNADLVVTQEDPWNVKFSLNAELFVNDLSGLASWNRTITSSTFVPVQGFGDPIYSISTNSLVFVNITKSPYVFDPLDINNLRNHALGSFYVVSPNNAPSFLNRLEGDLSSNLNGIESLVNLDKLVSAGVAVDSSRSDIDHEYFGVSSNECAVSPSGMPSWFKLNSNRVGDYQVVCV